MQLTVPCFVSPQSQGQGIPHGRAASWKNKTGLFFLSPSPLWAVTPANGLVATAGNDPQNILLTFYYPYILCFLCSAL